MCSLYDIQGLGTPLAVGRTAEIFTCPDKRVLKLFRPGRDKAEAQIEAQKAQTVHSAGLPVPAVYGLVEVEGRAGILYERITGISLLELIQTKPWKLVAAARMLADLHLELHTHSLAENPSVIERMRARFERMEDLPDDIRQKLMELLARVATGEAVCHGDFHPGNVFLTSSGPRIIDWMDAASGNPWADVARSSFLLSKSALPEEMPRRRTLELLRGIFHRTYLAHYFKENKPNRQEWNDWWTLVAASRIAENIPEERQMLIEIVEAGLSNNVT
jgi:thiamine kinase